MIFTDTVVAFASHDRLSARHIVKRNGPHVALCGAQLKPWGAYRVLDGFETGRDHPEADCRPCLFARALWLVVNTTTGLSREVENNVNGLVYDEERDLATVVVLSEVLRLSRLTRTSLVQEHFPADLIDRAVRMMMEAPA